MITADVVGTLRWWETSGAVVPPEPWWTVEDRGGFPPFWSAACGTPRPDGSVLPWPSEWDRRPHP